MKLVITGDTHYGFSDDTERILYEFYGRIKREKPDVLLHAGDWGTSNPKEVEAGLEQCARSVQTTLITVMGNHDFWCDETTRTEVQHYEAGFERKCGRLNMTRERGVAFLTGTHYGYDWQKEAQVGIIKIYGSSGWYSHPEPPTKDIMYMNPWVTGQNLGKTAFEFLKRQHERQAHLILDRVKDEDFNVYLTHFPGGEPWGSDPAIMREMAKHMDLIVRGHSHKKEDFQFDRARVLNAGSNYDEPKYIVVEINPQTKTIDKVEFK